MTDQSGRWRTALLTITRDGKLTCGSTGMPDGPSSIVTPSARTPATRENVLPSTRKIPARSQEKRRSAVLTMASNTGCTSVGEPLMTRRMSAVAVCRASDSCVSLNRRAFSIAITAWSANVCASDISWSSKLPSAARRIAMQPIARPSRSRGTNSADL